MLWVGIASFGCYDMHTAKHIEIRKCCVILWMIHALALTVNAQLPSTFQGAYWGLQPHAEGRQQLALLRQHGLDTALIKDGEYVLSLELLRQWAEVAQNHQIALLPVINFAGPSEINALQGSFRAYIDANGRSFPKTPCPLDAAYWNLSIFERMAQLAHLAQSAPLAGATFDTEMYGSDIRLYGSTPCFCDTCWQEFAQAMQPGAFRIPAAQRLAYLRDHQLQAAYTTFQQEQLRNLLQRLERGIHAINPDFAIGFLAYRPNWFYDAVTLGLGTPSQPVLVFTESSYVRGYTADIAQEQQRVLNAASGAARYIPGLWLERFFPDDLTAQLATMTTQADGYWLFTADSLWEKNWQSELYALHGGQQAYWEALGKANYTISTCLPQKSADIPVGKNSQQANQAIAECLPDMNERQEDAFTIYPPSFYDAERKKLFTPPSLMYMLYTVLTEKQRSGPQVRQPVVTFRGKNAFHGLITEEAVRQNRYIGISHSPQGSYTDPTHYLLFDSAGSLLSEGRLTPEAPTINILVSAEMAEVFSLLVDSGFNASVVTLDGIPAVVEASATFPLSTIGSTHTYGLYVPADQQHVRLSAYCAETEPAVLVVRSPDQQVDMQATIRGFSEFNIPVLGNGESFWSLAVTSTPYEMFEDVEFYLYNHEFPFVTVNPVR